MSEQQQSITVNVKCSNDTKYSVAIDPAATIADFKEAISKQSDTPPERQRLIYAGRVLKDSETVQSYKIGDGHTVHMVRGAATPGAASSTAPRTTSSNLRLFRL